jgi:RsmE family RNA methyltransferase
LKRESFLKKAERLRKIAKEAVEQSRWRKMPKIARCENIRERCEGKAVVVFDKWWIPPLSIETLMKGVSENGKSRCGIIWPEGGFTPRDYENFSAAQVVGLGDSVLRMETAAIIGAWVLKHS